MCRQFLYTLVLNVKEKNATSRTLAQHLIDQEEEEEEEACCLFADISKWNSFRSAGPLCFGELYRTRGVGWNRHKRMNGGVRCLNIWLVPYSAQLHLNALCATTAPCLCRRTGHVVAPPPLDVEKER